MTRAAAAHPFGAGSGPARQTTRLARSAAIAASS